MCTLNVNEQANPFNKLPVPTTNYGFELLVQKKKHTHTQQKTHTQQYTPTRTHACTRRPTTAQAYFLYKVLTSSQRSLTGGPKTHFNTRTRAHSSTHSCTHLAPTLHPPCTHEHAHSRSVTFASFNVLRVPNSLLLELVGRFIFFPGAAQPFYCFRGAAQPFYFFRGAAQPFYFFRGAAQPHPPLKDEPALRFLPPRLLWPLRPFRPLRLLCLLCGAERDAGRRDA